MDLKNSDKMFMTNVTATIYLKESFSKAFTEDYFKYLNLTGDCTQMLWAYTISNKIAEACRGMRFDVVDTPDYRTEGLFLKQAFKKYSIEVGKFVLALHGNTSVSESLGFNYRKGIDKNMALIDRKIDASMPLPHDGGYDPLASIQNENNVHVLEQSKRNK